VPVDLVYIGVRDQWPQRTITSPQFATRLMNKDFGLILKLAAELRVPMPATAAAF
jgi:3-hydroxyisobutyrate dehydrogenase-like beta-hydroxyacid dehydrogenase